MYRNLSRLRLLHNGPTSELTATWKGCGTLPAEFFQRVAEATYKASPFFFENAISAVARL
jgi:hypothetical protein